MTRPLPEHFSPQQVRFVTFVRDSRENGLALATAGSGKTTTIKAAAWHVPTTEKAAYFVYNREAKEQVGAGLPAHVSATTIHGDGYRRLAQLGLNMTMQRRKSQKLVQELGTTHPFPCAAGDRRAFVAGLAQFWDLVREHCGMTDPVQLYQLARQAALLPFLHTLESKALYDMLHALALEMQVRSIRDFQAGHGPDFTDLLWLPGALGCGAAQLQTVFVDEAQDLTPLRASYVAWVTGQHTRTPGRVLLIGDTDQAIYQYAGAKPACMLGLAEQLRAVKLPLSVSWRCPTAHIELAQHASHFIEAAPRAKQGKVRHVHVASLPTELKPGGVVLCRRNAPLIRLALTLLAAGISVNVRGRDLPAQLGAMAREAFPEPFTVEGLPKQMEAFTARREAAVQQAKQREALSKRDVQEMTDLIECLWVLSERAVADAEHGRASAADVEAEVTRLCNSAGKITLSTVHGAKGLEWSDVTILYPELLGTRSDEERCVLFVALTRSQHLLRLAYNDEAWASEVRVQPPACGPWMAQDEGEDELEMALQVVVAQRPPQVRHANPPAPESARPVHQALPQVVTLQPRANPRTANPPFDEAQRQQLLEAQAALERRRGEDLQQSFEVVPPERLEDTRPFALFHGEDEASVSALIDLMLQLKRGKRPVLQVWAAENLMRLRQIKVPSVLVDRARMTDLEAYVQVLERARWYARTSGRVETFVYVPDDNYRFVAVQGVRAAVEGSKLTVQLQGAATIPTAVVDAATGEGSTTSFDLWGLFATSA